jgi:hypothetical protein
METEGAHALRQHLIRILKIKPQQEEGAKGKGDAPNLVAHLTTQTAQETSGVETVIRP